MVNLCGVQASVFPSSQKKKKKKEGDAEGQLFCKIYFDQNLQQEWRRWHDAALF